MILKGKKVVVVGLARSGSAMARFLKKQGARVRVTDLSSHEQLGEAALEMERLAIPMELGPHRLETFENADLVVLSPGVPHTIAPVKRAAELGIPVMGEIELACRFIKEPVIAVTGTNGKTTTVTLLSKMLEASGFDVFTGGNIGTPLIEYAAGDHKKDLVVAELSSFQLDTIDTFKPHIAVLLNITEDHMNRYESFDAYISSKGRIFENQTQNDIAIVNGSDPHTDKLWKGLRSRKYLFGSNSADGNAEIKGEKIVFHMDGAERGSLDLTSAKIFGKHNHENIAAAALAALAAGAKLEKIQAALTRFRGLPHRIEYIDSINGVRFFNDSKATNVDAVEKALDAFETPLVLIMGGRDKGVSLAVLKESLKKNIKSVVAIGEAREKIKTMASGVVPASEALSLEEAVEIAYQATEPGDSVLLSPACASFDMFKNYNHRGEVFCKAVNHLKERLNG